MRGFRLPPATLSDALMLINADRLRPMLALVGVPKPLPTRKAEMVRAIATRLSGGRLRETWDRLDEHQQLAVRETLHSPEGVFDPARFRARYGRLPAGYKDTGYRKSSLLRFFLYPVDRYVDRPAVIPADLGKRLREFVPEPPEAMLAAADELPETVEQRLRGYAPKGNEKFRSVTLIRRDMERASAYDLLAVLRLVDRGRIAVSAKTRRASAVAMRRIAEVLTGGDFFDPTEKKKHSWSQVAGPIRSFAWPLLLQAARLAVPHGTKLALTRAGRAALGEPPANALYRLWQRWMNNSLLDEFSRIDVIKGQHRGKGKRSMTATADRRVAVGDALGECPVGRWVRLEEFSHFMYVTPFDFSVTHDPWRLYIGESQYGSLGYAGHHHWEIVQGRYVMCLLFEYAATLGLIDVAYTHPDGARHDFAGNWGTDDLAFLSRYDGLQYFRINPLGAWCLGIADEYVPAAPPPSASLTVYPDLRLQWEEPISADERLLLEMWATAETGGIWRLDQEKAFSAIEGGHDVDALRKFLAARDDQPLPETVEGFLRKTERDARALSQVGSALLIECASAEIADRIAADKRTARLCLRAGERHLAVYAAKANAFRRAIHALGYGMPHGQRASAADGRDDDRRRDRRLARTA